MADPASIAGTVFAIGYPMMLMSLIGINTAVAHGNAVTNWWRRTMYRSKTTDAMASHIGPLKFALMMVRLSMLNEESGNLNQTTLVGLEPQVLFMIKNLEEDGDDGDDNKRLKAYFFDPATGHKIRDFIYVPKSQFEINSVQIKHQSFIRAIKNRLVLGKPNPNKNRTGWTRTMVYPLISNNLICGFKFGTHQWFWGWQKKGLVPRLAGQAMRKTIIKLSSFSRFDECARVLQMDEGKMIPLTNQDEQAVALYRVAKSGMYHPQRQDEWQRAMAAKAGDPPVA